MEKVVNRLKTVGSEDFFQKRRRELNRFGQAVIGANSAMLLSFLCRYELIYEDAESQSCLERSLGVSLLRKVKNQVSGVVILVFNFVFSPFKPFR